MSMTQTRVYNANLQHKRFQHFLFGNKFRFIIIVPIHIWAWIDGKGLGFPFILKLPKENVDLVISRLSLSQWDFFFGGGGGGVIEKEINQCLQR
jgi:hypothetical protein